MSAIKISLKKDHGYLFFMALSFLLAVFKIIILMKYITLPVFFFVLGFFTYRFKPSKSLYLFFFLLPIVNAAPDFFFRGHPFNYMGIPLFYLSGIIISDRFLTRNFSTEALTGTNRGPTLKKISNVDFDFKWAGPYLLFVVLLWISALFLVLRWSNITLPSLAAWQDTPVTPAGDLLSFASIFPVVTLFLFSTTPYIPVLIKKNRLLEEKVFKILVLGYIISFAVALYQKLVDPDFMAIRWWGEKLDRYSGGFSDFNAFGYFSGALFLYLVIIAVNRAAAPDFKITRNNILAREFVFRVLGLLLTLSGIFLSGCRTAFLFILFAAAFLLFEKKIKLHYKLISIFLICILLIALGGTLKKRIMNMAGNMKKVGNSTNIITALDKVTNGRIEMMQRSIPIVKKYPLTGVGSGNFLFFLKYSNLGVKYWEDLPLNQYLLILDETGIIGLLVFVFFLTTLLKQKRKKMFSFLLFSILTAIFFNFFFWFPECLLLFWIFSSFSEDEITRPPRKKTELLVAILLTIFVLFNVLHFHSLHPKMWAKEKEREYGYGFWYLEKTENDEVYRWSKNQSGVYIYLDENGKSAPFKLFCGAPLSHFREKKQEVEIYWRGSLYKKVIFEKNEDFTFSIKGKPFAEGFLELLIHPTFSLKKMRLSPESRDLGVQFYSFF